MILHLISMRMCGKDFRNFDRTYCKIYVFKVKKQVLQYIARQEYLTLNPLNLNFLHYKILSFKSLLWRIELRV